MLLIIDFYEKMAVSSKRREQMNKVRVGMERADANFDWKLNGKEVEELKERMAFESIKISIYVHL